MKFKIVKVFLIVLILLTLGHPNCKLFITHGGIHGIMETIDAGVPFIGFPFFGDQFQNLKISQENGFGLINDIHTLNEDTFERDVKLILTDMRQVPIL